MERIAVLFNLESVNRIIGLVSYFPWKRAQILRKHAVDKWQITGIDSWILQAFLWRCYDASALMDDCYWVCIHTNNTVLTWLPHDVQRH